MARCLNDLLIHVRPLRSGCFLATFGNPKPEVLKTSRFSGCSSTDDQLWSRRFLHAYFDGKISTEFSHIQT